MNSSFITKSSVAASSRPGDYEVIVASDKEVKISPIREAFQSIFGSRVNVK